MQFLQRSIINKNSYVECEESEATYYRDPNDGQIKPVGELVANSRVERLSIPSSDKLPEPLPMPVMNFGDDDEPVKNSEHLSLPSFNFEAKDKDKEDKRFDNGLQLPIMQF